MTKIHNRHSKVPQGTPPPHKIRGLPRFPRPILFLFLLAITLTACQQAEQTTSIQTPPSLPTFSNLPETEVAGEATLFVDVSRAAGIVNTRQGNDRAIGQAWGDFNRDGWVDFYVTDTQGPNTLFRNNRDGTFAVAPQADDVALPEAYSGGASFADFDNDGWLDLYVVNWGGNVLFHNQAGQGFVDITTQAGVGDEANGQTASWGDYDQDGWLDLYVANWSCYPKCGRPSSGDPDRLFHNNGDGTFTNVTHLLQSKVNGAGFVASFTDYDNDGDLDIYLVNDEFLFPIGNALWRNDGPGCDGHCFTEVSTAAKADTQVMGMGLATADFDQDGRFDFYFSNAGPMTLLNNQGDGTFQDIAPQAGVDLPTGIAWGTAAFDYDNDGWQDLYLAVMTTADHKGISANPLFHNNGDGTFSRVRSGTGASDVGPTMGVATADFDNDGWVDLLIGNKDNGYSLLRNQTSKQTDNHWFTVDLVGAGPVNRDGVGTRVTAHTADGIKQMREVQNGSSLGAGNELALHFGLGTAVSITKLTIQWPNGLIQQFENVPADRRIQLSYPVDAAAEAAQLAVLFPNEGGETAVHSNILTSSLGVVLFALLVFIIVRSETSSIAWKQFRWGAGLSVLMGILVIGIVWTAANNAASPHNTNLDKLLAQAQVAIPARLPSPSPAKITLGEALFWDPLLSGNKDVSCATCHHPSLATGDALSLSIGVGGEGLGQNRTFITKRRVLIPRNAPPVYNLGLAGMDVLFWDGRVHGTPETGFDSPANDDMPYGLDNVTAVQAMFPVTSRDEMRGNYGDKDILGERNELATIKDHNWTAVWDGIMVRLLDVPAYQQLFAQAYPGVPLDELGFEHAANALAAYQMEIFTFLDSPWDNYLQGNEGALSAEAQEGALLFYGDAGCASCHSGPLLSDMRFHNIGVPQVGPGKGFEEPLDYGRARETGDESDLFAFRTPPLRNVAITGPWMHNGAYVELETAVRHHLNPTDALSTYDINQLTSIMLEEDSGDPETHFAALAAPSLTQLNNPLTDEDVAALLAFLEALTSPTAKQLSHTIPDTVPSGLPVEDGSSS